MIGDLLVNAAATQEQLREHFDDLRLQESLRGWIIPIKVTGTIGIVLGRRWPRLGAFTSLCFVLYFAFACGYHRKAEHRLPKYGPAVLYGAVAVRSFLTDLRRA